MKGANVLLLDDNREARWPLARVLRQAGAQVTEADDGTDGMRLLERTRFDLIIADVCMPRLGGFGLFSEIRFGDEDSLPYRHIPIILVTGQVGRGELARGMDAGLDDFITKPIDLEEFKARVGAVLRRTQAAAVPATRTHGDLEDFGMSALTQALHLGCRSGRLCVRSGDAFGLLDFQRGEIAHAVYTAKGYDVHGDEAAMRVLGLDHGTFELQPVPETAPRTAFLDTQSLLLRAATQVDETASAQAAADEAAAALGSVLGSALASDAAADGSEDDTDDEWEELTTETHTETHTRTETQTPAGSLLRALGD